MERLNLMRNGVLRLPPGFRFHPTDEELVVQYLKRKVLSCPLPASIIPEVDVCKSDPWDLPEKPAQENWVLCRIFLKRRSSKNDDEAAATENGGPAPVFYDFMAKERADLNLLPANSSSGSSGITEISNRNEPDDHEESSSCNSFIASLRRNKCP
ncbi:NAC domain-containing protein 83 [Sesamum alatum]|uniref:NAC domain-containing protein 83 n=1 Tax=Sesamum alatum TaxID=300844 RepID=A0AAE1XKN4_9LAMI|nr:NAC domain-containing protein 83 [Sesamum alatum]